MLDDLVTLLPTSKATWVLVTSGITTLAFALSAICVRSVGARSSAFFAAGAWLFGAFGVLVWYWR